MLFVRATSRMAGSTGALKQEYEVGNIEPQFRDSDLKRCGKETRVSRGQGDLKKFWL